MSYIKTTDFFSEVRKGSVNGHSVHAISGHNETVGGTYETIWEESSGTGVPAPTTAKQLTFSSSSANDTSAGTGLRTLLHTYLDGSYVLQTETITMNGQTAVNTVATDVFRTINLVGLTAGSLGVNDGTIYVGEGVVTAGKPASVYGLIALDADGVGNNYSLHGFYTVPDGKTAYLQGVLQSVQGNKDVETKMMIKTETGLVLNLGQITDIGGAHQFGVKATAAFTEHTDLWFESFVASGSADVSLFVELLLVDN